MMRTIAIMNQKGGSGKTTTAVNLAATLAERDRRVLVLDLDPQHSTTTWWDVTEGGRGVFDLFAEPENTPLAALIFETATPGVSLIPSSAWLVGAEKALAGEPGAELCLRRKLKEVPAGRFDYLLIDCPPNLGILTVNALGAAREVLVPVECRVMGLHGLGQLTRTVDLVRDRLNEHLAITGILACRVDRRTRHSKEVVEQLQTRFPALAFRTVIRENIKLGECPSHGLPITAYAASSSGTADYRALAGEVVAQEHGAEDTYQTGETLYG